MVMKVEHLHPIAFRSSQTLKKTDNISGEYQQIKELGYVTPSFSVQTPQKYQSLGIKELDNGLKIHSYKLANGYRVTIVPMENSPAVVKNYVNVGSMNETDDIKGISHFLEHMAFNGTNGENGYIKLNQGDSFKKIDKLGGWINASTNYAITDYVNSTPLLKDSDLEEQIKIIAGMTEDLALSEKMIEKEKGPVCSEINMILDDPQTIVMDQAVRTLFNIKSSADELVGGSTTHIKNLTKEKVKQYYDKYYTPDNMNLVITGEVDPQKTIELVSKNFHSTRKTTGNRFEEKLNPISKTIRKDFITDKATSAEIMLAFKGPNNNDLKSKLIFDVVNEYLNSSEVGLYKDMKKLNSYGFFGNEKISTNPYNPTLIYYATSSADENSEKVLKTFYNRLANVPPITEKRLAIIKNSLEQSFQNTLEYSSAVNNIIGNDIINGYSNGIEDYSKILKEITPNDVDNFIKEYIDLNKVAITVAHPKTTNEKLIENHKAAINFKARKPINTEKISETTLENNYKIAFYDTKNKNINFNIMLNYERPEEFNQATIEVLSEILNKGSALTSEDDFIKFEEDNNLGISANLKKRKLVISGYSNSNNFEITLDKAKEILYTPRINQKEISDAISQIKDNINRSQDTAYSIYVENESKNNSEYTSKTQLLKDLENVTVEDVVNLHKYILNNSQGLITMNTPESENIKDLALNSFKNLKKVNSYKYSIPNIYTENAESKVLTKEKPVSQADIMQIYKYKFDDNIKERAMMEILNTILSSSSIGLFNNLREKEQLAYSVYSDVGHKGNSGYLSCNILTTTDNKDNGEISYSNIQKSIEGFHRQIDALKNSMYTDEDLESAKNIFKAKLLETEGNYSKLRALRNGLDSYEGIDYQNQLFNVIDNITREDIDVFSKKVFANPPTYSIVASKDSLEANKDFFETL